MKSVFLFNKTAIFQDDRNVMNMGSQLSHQRWWLCRFFRVCFFSLHLFTFSVAFAQFSFKCIYKVEKSLLLSYVMRFKRATSLGEHCIPPIGIKTSLTTGNSINFYTPTYFLAKKHTHRINGHSTVLMLIPINIGLSLRRDHRYKPT